MMDDESTRYTSADLLETILKIKQYLKTNSLKIFYSTTIPSSLNPNKRPCHTQKSNVYTHLICYIKNSHHRIDKC